MDLQRAVRNTLLYKQLLVKSCGRKLLQFLHGLLLLSSLGSGGQWLIIGWLASFPTFLFVAHNVTIKNAKLMGNKCLYTDGSVTMKIE